MNDHTPLAYVSGWDKKDYPNFSPHEFACSHCGEVKVYTILLSALQWIRHECNYLMPITSGYRCPNHPVEKRKKTKNGPHVQGVAADILLREPDQFDALLGTALGEQIPKIYRPHGIGINLKGQWNRDRFIHFDFAGRGRRWGY